jgi:hypothetical protein
LVPGRKPLLRGEIKSQQTANRSPGSASGGQQQSAWNRFPWHAFPPGRQVLVSGIPDNHDSSLINSVSATVLPLADSAVPASRTADGVRITNRTGRLTDTQLTGRGMGQGIS